MVWTVSFTWSFAVLKGAILPWAGQVLWFGHHYVTDSVVAI